MSLSILERIFLIKSLARLKILAFEVTWVPVDTVTSAVSSVFLA